MGVVLINTAAVIGIAIVAHRRGGPLAATAAMAMTAALTWTMGSELLFDPWQPHAMLLPFLLFLVLIWSLACGDLVMLPFAVGVASLVLQTHLSYAVLVPVLAVWGAGTLAWSIRGRRRADPDGWPPLRRKVRRTVLVSTVLFVVLWLPPFIEEAVHGRDGNLSLLVSTLGKPKQNIGWNIGSRLVASVLALPPWWLRPSFGNAFVPKSDGRPLSGVQPELAQVPSIVAALVSLAVVIGALALLCRYARRHADHTAVALLATALVATGGALLTAASLPIGFFGIAPHQFRWLWPISVFMLFAALLTLARRRPPVDTTRLTGAFAVGTLVLSLLNLPTNNQQVGPSADAGSIPSARTLVDQLGVLDGSGTLLFDIRGLRFAEPYSVPVINELDRRGVDVVVDDPGMVRQLGDGRRFDGHANGRIFTREADAALLAEPEPGREASRDRIWLERRRATRARRPSQPDQCVPREWAVASVPVGAGDDDLAGGPAVAPARRPDRRAPATERARTRQHVATEVRALRRTAETLGCLHRRSVPGAAEPTVISVRRRPATAIVVIVAIGFGLRLAWVLYAARGPVGLHDPLLYRFLSDAVAHGHGYSYPPPFNGPGIGFAPTAYYPPGYPLLLGGFEWLTLHTPIPEGLTTIVSLVNLVAGTASIVLVYGITRRLTNERTGLVAAGLVAAVAEPHRPHCAHVERDRVHRIDVAHPVGGGEASGAAGIRGVGCRAAGAALGLATLVRPVALPLVAAFGIAWLIAGVPWRDVALRAGVITVVCVAVLVPWIVRNAVVMGSPVLSTNTGDNLCMSRQPGATGGFELTTFCNSDLTGLHRPASEIKKDDDGQHKAITFVRDHPGT